MKHEVALGVNHHLGIRALQLFQQHPRAFVLGFVSVVRVCYRADADALAVVGVRVTLFLLCFYQLSVLHILVEEGI